MISIERPLREMIESYIINISEMKKKKEDFSLEKNHLSWLFILAKNNGEIPEKDLKQYDIIRSLLMIEEKILANPDYQKDFSSEKLEGRFKGFYRNLKL